MSKNWRISSFNGVLLAGYFIPAWILVAYQIMVSPVHGLYERPSIAVALYVSDHLQLFGMATVRIAWLLALARITTAAFFAIFLVLLAIPAARRRGGAEEALGIALALGSLLSFASMVMAAQVGETAAMRMHVSELLMLLGTTIVMAIERPAPRAVEHDSMAGELSLQQT
jgi:hypothetical protein